jgi:hypothetical protein
MPYEILEVKSGDSTTIDLFELTGQVCVRDAFFERRRLADIRESLD